MTDRELLELAAKAAGFDHDGQAVCTKKLRAVLLKRLDVFMADRHLLFKSGFHA
jgi:hypothetical protein